MTLEQGPALACTLMLSVGAHLATLVVLPRLEPTRPPSTRKVELELYAPPPVPPVAVPPLRVEAPRLRGERKARVKLAPAKPVEATSSPPLPPAPVAPQPLTPIVGTTRQSTTAPGDFVIPSGAPRSTDQGDQSPWGRRRREAEGSGAGDSEPLLLSEVRILYPDEAMRSGVTGSVRLQVTIDASGQVTGVTVISGPGFGLDQAAREALWKFRFKPGSRRGAQVGSTFEYAYRFELD